MEVIASEFARMAGVSAMAVSSKIKNGTLIRNSAGRLDTDNPVNRAYLERKQEKMRQRLAERTLEATATGNAPAATPAPHPAAVGGYFPGGSGASSRAAMSAGDMLRLPPLYNPPGMFGWEDYVAQWAEAWDIANNRIRDKEKYRAFRNLKQGLPFREQHEQITYEKAVRFRRFGFARGHVGRRELDD